MVGVPESKKSAMKEGGGPWSIARGRGDYFTVDPKTGLWFCHSECDFGGGILKLELALTNEDFSTCKSTAFQLMGRTESENWHGGTGVNSYGAASLEPANSNATDGCKEVERYPYQDVDGNLLFEVIRCEKPDGQKFFWQCRPDGQGDVIKNLGDIERVPYRLPKLIKAETVYLAEGEKDVHTLQQ